MAKSKDWAITTPLASFRRGSDEDNIIVIFLKGHFLGEYGIVDS
jgi:hypothetical protein